MHALIRLIVRRISPAGILVLLSVFPPVLVFPVDAASSMGGMSMGSGASSGPSSQAPTAENAGGIPGTGFAVEGFAGADTSLSGSYGTSSGQTIPYDFGSAPLWGLRVGKMIFSPLFFYLTFQQSYFSQNTHTIIGFGGNYDLPSPDSGRIVPYLNATFGASYNTFGGVDAQAGYAWMLGAGVLVPLNRTWQVFLEADAAYETAPLGINTDVGNPPGNVAHVSDTWSVPVMVGVRYAF
jgi:hypothetical protein